MKTTVPLTKSRNVAKIMAEEVVVIEVEVVDKVEAEGVEEGDAITSEYTSTHRHEILYQERTGRSYRESHASGARKRAILQISAQKEYRRAQATTSLLRRLLMDIPAHQTMIRKVYKLGRLRPHMPKN